jgi:hypothetical protein
MLVPRHRNVLAVLATPRGKLLIPASNIVTDAGDLHYAQRAVTEALTNAFDTFLMATAGTPAKGADDDDFTVVAASEASTDATYPKRNDGDADNTGAGVDIVTHRVSYTTAFGGEPWTNVTHGIITNPAPGVAEPILTGWAFGSGFTKQTTDTLKVFVNHEMSGQ